MQDVVDLAPDVLGASTAVRPVCLSAAGSDGNMRAPIEFFSSNLVVVYEMIVYGMAALLLLAILLVVVFTVKLVHMLA